MTEADQVQSMSEKETEEIRRSRYSSTNEGLHKSPQHHPTPHKGISSLVSRREYGVNLAAESVREYVRSTFHQKVSPEELETISEGASPSTDENGLLPTYAFGKINFKKDAKSTYEPPYVCLSDTDDKQALMRLMSELWHLPEPKLIVSIVGGAKRFHTNHFSKNRIETLFKQGLLDIATSTGAWILTPGSNTGVYKMVGSAVREHIESTSSSSMNNIVLLGIASWGAVAKRGNLFHPEGEGHFPAIYPTSEIRGQRRQTHPLDPNHSHFILIDDGSRDVFEGESQWRLDFEKLLKSQILQSGIKTHSPESAEEVHIPMVTLLINGGDGSLESCSLSLPTGIPLVAIAGSGRAAEVIVSLHRRLLDLGDGVKPERKDLTDVYEKGMGCKPDEKAVGYLELIAESYKRISVFDPIQPQIIADDIGLDRAILAALYHKEELNIGKRKAQMILALAWNRADFAKEEILNINNADYQDFMSEKDFLSDIAFEALLDDSYELVGLLVDHGLDLKEFVSDSRLQKLYEKSMLADGAFPRFTKLLFDSQARSNRAGCSSCVAQDVCPEQNYMLKVGELVASILGHSYPNIYEKPSLEKEEVSIEVTSTDIHYDDPAQHIFLWAILLNRIELARMFWKLADDHIAGAIVGAALLRALAKKSDHEEGVDITASYQENSLKFEVLAKGILDCCWSRDRQYTSDMLVREAPNWGNQTVFTLAYNAEMEEFIAEPACYTKLNKIWRGDIALRTHIFWIVLFAFMPLAVFMLSFVKKRDQDRRTDEQQAELIESDDIFISDYNRKIAYKSVLSVTLSGNTEGTISFPQAIHRAFRAPIVKSIHYTIFFIVFVIVFSMFLMTELRPMSTVVLANTTGNCSTCCFGATAPIGCLELATYACVIVFFMEELRQIIFREQKNLRHGSDRIKDWFRDFWNKVDVVSHLLFVVAVCLRFTVKPEHFEVVIWLYSCSLVIHFTRFSQILFVVEQLGPKIIMIKKMMVDLLFFIIILTITILVFGVIRQSLLNPQSPISWSLLKDVFYKPYFQMYGELFLDDHGEDRSWILLAIYMIITNILLLNLLIAMFSYTFQQVQDKAAILWKYNYYAVVYEHFDRPYLPLLGPIYQLLKSCIWSTSCCSRRDSHRDTDFQRRLGGDENSKITRFVKLCMEKYIAQESRSLKESKSTHKEAGHASGNRGKQSTLEMRVTNMDTKLDKILQLMECQY